MDAEWAQNVKMLYHTISNLCCIAVSPNLNLWPVNP